MMKIAMVEDSALVRQSMTRLLQSVDGIDVVGYADDVPSALELIDAERPDVILLDVELRNGDRGMAVLRHTVRTHPSIDVVAMSNFGWQAMRMSFLQAGAKAYFDKATEFIAARDWIARRAVARPRADCIPSAGERQWRAEALAAQP